ncbi:iron-sulfur cluster assembly scaffold protein [Patulibacter defluvii]|uniref:iron-sulfur cluster assembly scaffold protein n=1 Tax=Patulibacter defluvii TaxID=3095358 RepID=UPI002A765480|nr:iron-sulfur cluster assembly scaffold protein [Patulibacter sp. DM4]
MERKAYRALIVEHVRAPRRRGRLDDATHEATVHSPVCGDWIRASARVRDGRIEDLRFDGQGCAISQGAASLCSAPLVGMAAAELDDLDVRWVEGLLGDRLSAGRHGCAELHLRALRRALAGG